MNSERLAKIVLQGVFLSTLAIATSLRELSLSPCEWVMLGLAIVRCGRMIAFELIMEPWRSTVAKTVEHAHAGMTTEPKYDSGWRQSLGQLVTCPICAGTWSALVLIVGLLFWPSLFHVLIILLSAVELGEVVHELIERLCWGAAAARKQSR